MIIVSACLAGINCKYDGGNNSCKAVVDLVKKKKAIPMCPEQLGGMTTPREPSQQKNEKVVSETGKDVTKNFEKGAEEVLRVAKLVGCKKAILKAKSPSCGCGKIYDGTFSKKLIDGDGVLTKKLKENNIKVITEEEI